MTRIIPVIIAIVILMSILRHGGLFPVIFLLVIGLSIYNQLKKATGKGRGTIPEWKKKLDEALGQIRREMDANSTRNRRKPAAAEWERLSANADAEIVDIEPLSVDSVTPKEKGTSGSGNQRAASRPVRNREEAGTPMRGRIGPAGLSDGLPAASHEPESYGLALSETRFHELRKAVVWSEILAKPLALRGRER